SFRLLDLASAATALAGDGTETVGSLTPARETDVYSFTASAGERFAWDSTQSPFYASFRLIDPFGRDATSALGYDDKTFVTEFAGTYHLLVEGRAWDVEATRPYRFVLHRMVEPAPLPLSVGATATAVIDQPTKRIRYQVTLAEPTRLYVDSNTPDG